MKILVTALAIATATGITAAQADNRLGLLGQQTPETITAAACPVPGEPDTSHLSDAVFGWELAETEDYAQFVWADTPVGVAFGGAPAVVPRVATGPAPGEPDTSDIRDEAFGWDNSDTVAYYAFVWADTSAVVAQGEGRVANTVAARRAASGEPDTSHLSDAVFGWESADTRTYASFVWADTPVGIAFGPAPATVVYVATAPATGEPDTGDLSDEVFGWTAADTQIQAAFVNHHRASEMFAESAY